MFLQGDYSHVLADNMAHQGLFSNKVKILPQLKNKGTDIRQSSPVEELTIW